MTNQTEKSQLESVREDAEKYDEQILGLLEKRLREPIGYNPPKKLTQDSVMIYQLSAGFYSQILQALVPNTCYEIHETDLELVRLIIKRANDIGERVGRYKGPRGQELKVQSVEDNKIIRRRQEARERGIPLSLRQIRDIYRIIFNETIKVEELVKNEGAAIGVESIITDDETSVTTLKRILEERGEILKRQGKLQFYTIKSNAEKTPGHLTRYTVTLYPK